MAETTGPAPQKLALALTPSPNSHMTIACTRTHQALCTKAAPPTA